MLYVVARRKPFTDRRPLGAAVEMPSPILGEGLPGMSGAQFVKRFYPDRKGVSVRLSASRRICPR